MPHGATGGAKWATGAPAGGAHTKHYATALTSENAKIYQDISGILSLIQTKVSEHVDDTLLIGLQSLMGSIA